MNRVILSTPARLHFGLLDLNGEIGRIDGGVGLALESPHTLIEAEKAEQVTAECGDEPEITQRVVTALDAVREHLGIGGAHINNLMLRREGIELDHFKRLSKYLFLLKGYIFIIVYIL